MPRPGGQAGGVSSASPPQRLLLTGLVMSCLGVAFQAFGVVTAMPDVMRDLDGVAFYAWAFTTFVIAMLFATVVAGRACDRVGVAKPLLVGFVLFCAGLLLAAASSSLWTFLAARLIQGLGGGALNVSLFVAIALAFDEAMRPRVMMVMSFAWLLPAFVGPPLAGSVTRELGWRWVFAAVVPLMLLGGALSLRPLLSLQRAWRRPEATGASIPVWAGALAAGGVLALQVGGQHLAWSSVPLALIGLVAIVAAVRAIMPAGFGRAAPGLPSVLLVRLLQAGTFFAAEPFLVMMLQDVHRFSATRAGWALTIGSIGWTFGSWLQSRAWFSMPRHEMLRLGAASSTAGLACLAVLTWWPSVSLVIGGIGWVVAGFGMGMMSTSTAVAVMSLSATHELGRNNSALQVGEALGNALLTALAGTLFAAWHAVGADRIGMAVGFTVLAVIGVGAVWVATRVGPISSAARDNG